jgi:hypothetical protein
MHEPQVDPSGEVQVIQGQIAIFCEHKKCTRIFGIRGNGLLTPSKTDVRRQAKQEGWRVARFGRLGDFCPKHASASQQAEPEARK